MGGRFTGSCLPIRPTARVPKIKTTSKRKEAFMVYSYVYFLWAVFIFLESFAVTRLKNKGLEPIRSFMIFCIFRDLLLMASASTQWYWDIGWAGKEIELVWLAGIAGFLIRPGRAWRLPAFTLSTLFIVMLWRYGWPFWASDPADLHILQRMACIIILGTVLIGVLFNPNAPKLPLLGSLVVLAGSDMISAQTYLTGNFSPRLAAATWVVGLCILVIAARGSAELIQHQKSDSLAAEASSSNSPMCQSLEWPSETKPQDAQNWEFLELPCHRTVQ